MCAGWRGGGSWPGGWLASQPPSRPKHPPPLAGAPTTCPWSCGLVDQFRVTCLSFEPFLLMLFFFWKMDCGPNFVCLCVPFYFLFKIFWIIFVNMNWWIISFVELTFLDHIFSTQIGGLFVFWNLLFFSHKFFTPYVTFTTCWIIILDDELVDHISA